MSFTYQELINRRRALKISPYLNLAEVGCDGPWITPLQITSRSDDGPALIALHWLDQPSIEIHRPILLEKGYLPGIRFNRVLDHALNMRGMSRPDIYLTQAFHLIPTGRSDQISREAIDFSFDEVTRRELIARKVVALGAVAAAQCTRHGIPHEATCHPSRRGFSNIENAANIADAIGRVGY